MTAQRKWDWRTWLIYTGMVCITAYYSHVWGYRDGVRDTYQKVTPILQKTVDDLEQARVNYHQTMRTWLCYIRGLTGLDENTTLQERVDRVWQTFCMDPLEG